MTYGGLAHGERFFPDKLKAHLPIENEGLSVFHHHAYPELIKTLFCSMPLCSFEKLLTDVLTLELWRKIERGDVEAILISVEEEPCVTDKLIICLCNETLHEGVVEHAQEGRLGIMSVEIGLEVALGDESRVCRNPGQPSYSSDGLKITFPPGPDDDFHLICVILHEGASPSKHKSDLSGNVIRLGLRSLLGPKSKGYGQ